jgi:beta-glucosidase
MSEMKVEVGANSHPADDVDELNLVDQAALTVGVGWWHTAGAAVLGLDGVHVTDGPNGARGARWGEISSCLPSATSLAATWDPPLVRLIGEVLGEEALDKGARVLLAPTVNIHRTPLGGRSFECFSEDPVLSGAMAVAYVQGVQSQGVGCAIKHFVCNDQELERMSIDVEIDERSLREIYLPPFEAAVRDANVFIVMSAYNQLRGHFCSENRDLLVGLLKEEWGFQGVVVSDWFGTRSTAALDAGLDLEMPGPASFFGPRLIDAVSRGEVGADAVRAAAERMLRLLRRLGASPAGVRRSAEERATFARQAAASGIVLLKNESSILPLDLGVIARLAVIGPAAARLCPQGAGAAEVTPPYVRSPLPAILERAGAMTVTYEPGCMIPGPVLPLGPSGLRTGNGAEGIEVEYFAGDEAEAQAVHRDVFTVSRLVWLGSPHPSIAQGQFRARATTNFTPDRTGTWDFGLVATGTARLSLDDALLLDTADAPPGEGFFGMGTEEVTAAVELVEGVVCTLTLDFRVDDAEMPVAAVSFGAAFRPPEDSLTAATDAARASDVALVVVGTDSRWETEGKDRSTLRLPGDQDVLVSAVAAANPRTIVVINSGAPVEMPWADEVDGIVQVWYPGQEGGTAIADVLFGDIDASGRLPTTFPVRLEDTPAHPFYPGDGQTLHYDEGLMVGYRHYDTKGVAPRFCFGHGLSYTTFDYGALTLTRKGSDVVVEVDVTNTGPRRGAEVVQVYVCRPGSQIERPEKELKAFEKIWLDPGQSTRIDLHLGDHAFRHWDVSEGQWQIEPGEVEVLVGASSREIRLRGTTTL